jgi:hypothetical protein
LPYAHTRDMLIGFDILEKSSRYLIAAHDVSLGHPKIMCILYLFESLNLLYLCLP